MAHENAPDSRGRGVGEHLAGKVVQGGKEGDRSVPVIVVGAGADVSLA
jgi:hypothetical protein